MFNTCISLEFLYCSWFYINFSYFEWSSALGSVGCEFGALNGVITEGGCWGMLGSCFGQEAFDRINHTKIESTIWS